MRPSLYDYAGGSDAMLRLAQAHHERCLADPELNHPFSHGDLDPEHIQRLASYWGEVFGGPPAYSATGRTQTFVVAMHAGNGDMSDLGRRFVDCFVLAATDAGLPDEAEFRASLRSYMEWAMTPFLAHPDSADTVPADLAIPRWGWTGLASE